MKPKYVFFLMFLSCLLGIFSGCDKKCDSKEKEDTHYYSGTQIYFSFPDSVVMPIKMKQMKKDLTLLEADYLVRTSVPLVVAMRVGETVDFALDEMEITIDPMQDFARLAALDIQYLILDDEGNSEETPCIAGQTRSFTGTVYDSNGSPLRDVNVYDGRRPDDIAVRTSTNSDGGFTIELLLDDSCIGIVGIKYNDTNIFQMSTSSKNIEVHVYMDDSQHRETKSITNLQDTISLTRDLR